MGIGKGESSENQHKQYRKREKKKFDPGIAWVYAMLGMWLQKGNVGKSTFACGLEGEFVE
jgi:hypothetical protein